MLEKNHCLRTFLNLLLHFYKFFQILAFKIPSYIFNSGLHIFKYISKFYRNAGNCDNYHISILMKKITQLFFKQIFIFSCSNCDCPKLLKIYSWLNFVLLTHLQSFFTTSVTNTIKFLHPNTNYQGKLKH